MVGKKPFNCNFKYDIKAPLNNIYFDTQHLEFTSEFEGGNIEKVFRIGEREYNIYIRADSNTKGCF